MVLVASVVAATSNSGVVLSLLRILLSFPDVPSSSLCSICIHSQPLSSLRPRPTRSSGYVSLPAPIYPSFAIRIRRPGSSPSFHPGIEGVT